MELQELSQHRQETVIPPPQPLKQDRKAEVGLDVTPLIKSREKSFAIGSSDISTSPRLILARAAARDDPSDGKILKLTEPTRALSTT
jgi:hypothetical protein